MNRHARKLGIAAVAVGLAVAAGATALAAGGLHGPGRHHAMMKKHVEAMVDDALDAAKATPDQRAKIHAAEEGAFAAMQQQQPQGRAGHREMIEKVTALFLADAPDRAEVKALRAAHEAQGRQRVDAIVQALTTAHDALQPAQRKAVADYVRGHRPGRHGAMLRGEMMKRMASARLDEALDAIGANATQRAQIEAARDHVIQTIEALHPEAAMPEAMDKALAIFEADRVDPAAVKALRAEHEQKLAKVADAVEQAAFDLHDALTPAQRKALVEHVKAERAKWGARFGGRGPGGPEVEAGGAF